jgi:hypothetical protein
MAQHPTDRLRRLLVSEPARAPAYDAIVIAAGTDDIGASLAAAFRACVLAPADRRLRKNLLFLLQRSDRWDELSSWVPRQPQPLPPRATHPVDLGAIQDRYRWLMDQLHGERSGEAWTPSAIEGWKRDFHMDDRHLANFRRSELSSGTQTPPDRPAAFPRLDFEHLYPALTDEERALHAPVLRRTFLTLLTRLYRAGCREIDRYDAAALDDDRFGARLVELDGVGPVTAKSIQSAYYACRAASLVPRNGTVLEIGGGFGMLASRLLAIRPDVTYVLTDLPVNMVLTHTYLTSHYGDAVAGLWEDGDRPGPGQRALVVPPWRLAGLPLQVDLAVNTMSFQHMDERNHAFYGDALRRLGTRRLYHVNRNVFRQPAGQDTMVVPAERYGFMADYVTVVSDGFDGQWVEVIAEART